jgi:hypothetical protein
MSENDGNWRTLARPFSAAEIAEFESRFAEHERYDILYDGLWPDAQETGQ